MGNAPTLDGARFDNFEGFRDEVNRALPLAHPWNGSLDALVDLVWDLDGLTWVNAARSRALLGHDETARWLESRLGKVHAANRRVWELKLARARRGEGETLFDTLTQLIGEAGVALTLVE